MEATRAPWQGSDELICLRESTVIHTLVHPRAYHDSVTLMLLSGELLSLEGIEDASVVMATEHNKEQLERVGLLGESAKAAGPNDLVIAVRSEDPDCLRRVQEAIDDFMARRRVVGGGSGYCPVSLEAALKEDPEANLLLVSIPGRHAGREARKALEAGLHVMLFSDNVPVEEEKALKEMARDRGLLVMGPDCGTAILNGAPLAFANMTPRGPVGIVGASGTGIQEISCCLSKSGVGISQAIGTGGRDLSEAIGGITMLAGLDALAQDPGTEIIVLVSKPPAATVADRVIRRAREIPKPVVVHFVGAPLESPPEGVWDSRTLEEAARIAAALSKGESPDRDEAIVLPSEALEAIVSQTKRLADGQVHLRGLFSGGTLCDEAAMICTKHLGRVYNNVSHDPETRLVDPLSSREHCVVDLGDDCFTQGRPHPMIDPGSRKERILVEGEDPTTAVILLDVVLGTGSHPDMAEALAPTIEAAQRKAAEDGRGLVFVASITGTQDDPQNLSEQTARLEAAGVLVLESNAQAAEAAARIVARGGRA